MTIIALLDDAHLTQKNIATFFKIRGYTVNHCVSLAEFLLLIQTSTIAIFDIRLLGSEKLETLLSIREQYPHLGIIVLTNHSTVQDKLNGLYAGADHYLIHPFPLLELEAIVESLLRRIGGGWCLDLKRCRLIAPNGDFAILSAQEMTLFKLLSEHPGQIVTRRTFVEALGHRWLDYDLRRLDTFISRLRRRWREQCQQELPLKTAYGEGYIFNCNIKKIQ